VFDVIVHRDAYGYNLSDIKEASESGDENEEADGVAYHHAHLIVYVEDESSLPSAPLRNWKLLQSTPNDCFDNVVDAMADLLRSLQELLFNFTGYVYRSNVVRKHNTNTLQ
jgi:hypothetical protein